MSTITIGVDLAKSNFLVCKVEAAGQVRGRQDLGRTAQRPADQHAITAAPMA